jgi:hypothetical protein
VSALGQRQSRDAAHVVISTIRNLTRAEFSRLSRVAGVPTEELVAFCDDRHSLQPWALRRVVEALWPAREVSGYLSQLRPTQRRRLGLAATGRR